MQPVRYLHALVNKLAVHNSLCCQPLRLYQSSSLASCTASCTPCYLLGACCYLLLKSLAAAEGSNCLLLLLLLLLLDVAAMSLLLLLPVLGIYGFGAVMLESSIYVSGIALESVSDA